MADNTKLEPRSLPSIPQPAPTSPAIPPKQKESPALKHWEAHHLTCSILGQSSSDPVIYTPESIAETLAHPSVKRRRAKRTEEERINYLRADPYVAQFEAHRVLCASCDRWIRLRPNLTYCSIPWDTHRKCCLAKKVNSRNMYAVAARQVLFSKDLDISKYDAERVLHRQAVQKWLEHRAACQKESTATLPLNQPTLPEPVLAPTIGPGCRPKSRGVQLLFPHSVSPVSSKPAQSSKVQPHTHASDNPSFGGCNPSNYAPTHESRRRNAEDRAAKLMADSLISEVEPNRVLCSLCQKWVQLRQDSSYCAYPWLQHRGKCLARHASGKPSFQPSHSHNGHAYHQGDTAVGSIQQSPTIIVENPISEVNYYLTLAENTIKPTNVYNEFGIAQGISESGLAAANYHINNGQSSYYPGDPAVDSTAQLPTVAVEAPTSTYCVTHENTNKPAFTNAFTAQGISASGIAVANHLIPGYRVGNSYTLPSTHNPELQTLFSGVNNVQSSYYPGNPAVGSIPTMAVEATSANYYLSPGENTNPYSRVSDGNTVNWHCNLSGCQYVSRSRRDMERHCSNLRHGGCREHQCEYCGKVFVREDTLRRHVKETRCWLRQG